MTTSVDVLESNAWCIKTIEKDGKTQRVIVNSYLPIDLNDDVYNYSIYTPVILAPINKSSTFVLSGHYSNNDLKLTLHDLRIFDNQIVNSVGFSLRGHQTQLKKLRNELSRLADQYQCVGISFFFRKLFFANFRTIYCDKVLAPKQNSTLRAALQIVNSTGNTGDNVEQK